MHEIEELERCWKRYRFKKLLPRYAGIGMGVLIVGAVGYFYTQSTPSDISALPAPVLKPKEPSTPKESLKTVRKETIAKASDISKAPTPPSKPESTTKFEKVEKAPSPKPTMKAVRASKKVEAIETEHPRKKIVLNPDNAFLRRIAKDVRSQKPHHKISSRRGPVKEEKIALSKPKTKKSKKIEPARAERVKKRFSTRNIVTQDAGVQVVSTKTNRTLEHIIDRFNQTRDPKLALYVAQSFYKKREYKKAVRWSIVANSIEPSNEASWILYAKAKVKLGHRNEAIKALKIYLNQYVSRKVQTYLEYLESMP